jgi:16S rRNA (uracil1498-N3)-methyltransferase
VERQTRDIDTTPDLWLCFAPVKKARLDWIIEKATELGVSCLQPIITERTIVDRVKAERLQAQMIEACEQCGRTSLPSLAEPVKLTTLIENWPVERAILFADEAGGTAMSQLHAPPPAAIFVGPEGGFTDRERTMLLACPATLRLGLGPRILRAETAVVAAISLWMEAHGDWQRP